MIELEYEEKILLRPEEFAMMKRLIGEPIQFYKQINYYYDTAELDMNRIGTTLRIREKDGIYTATIKEHNHNYNVEKSKRVKNEFDVSLFSVKGVRLLGSLLTERICMLKEDGLEIVLDKNIYLDTTDYELEIEYSPKNEGKAKEVICNIGNLLDKEKTCNSDYCEFYNRTKLAKSKSQRFFERLKNIKQ